MFSRDRRKILRNSIGLAAALSASGRAAAQLGHDDRLTIVVPFPAGGITDIITRLVGQRLNKSLGVNVVIDNRPGAGGRIGTAYVKRAAPDGRTILLGGTVTLITGPLVWKEVPYNPVTDFAPISNGFEFELALAVAPGVPVKDLAEYQKWVAMSPRNAIVGSPSSGGLGHLLTLQLARSLKANIEHLAYKGSAPLQNDLMGAQVPAGMDTIDAQLRSRGIKVMATTGQRRSPALPGVPTFAELGYPEMQGAGWFGYLAPQHTPAPIIRQLSNAIQEAMTDPEIAARMRALSYASAASTPEDFAARIKSDRERWGAIVSSSGLSIDE